MEFLCDLITRFLFHLFFCFSFLACIPPRIIILKYTHTHSQPTALNGNLNPSQFFLNCATKGERNLFYCNIKTRKSSIRNYNRSFLQFRFKNVASEENLRSFHRLLYITIVVNDAFCLILRAKRSKSCNLFFRDVNWRTINDPLNGGEIWWRC